MYFKGKIWNCKYLLKLHVEIEVEVELQLQHFFYKFIWAINIRKTVWKLCIIFFFGILSSCFTRLQSGKVLLFMGVECCAVKNVRDRASSSVRTYTINLCPSKKKKIYPPRYMSYSNHEWWIWKVYQRPFKPQNNISKVHTDPELGMNKLFLHTVACICKNQISHSVWGTKKNQNR